MTVERLAVPLSVSLLGWALTALVVHCVASLFSRATSALKRYSGKQLLATVVVSASSSASSGGRALLQTATSLLRWWLFFLIVFLFFAAIHVTYTEIPQTWTSAARVYNERLGPYLHLAVLTPLRLLDLVLRALLPVWNSVVWFFKALGVQGLLPILVEQVSILLRLSVALVALVQHLAVALLEFFESLACAGRDCLRPEAGVLDLVTSMGDVREAAALGVQVVRSFCSTLAAPLDLVFYPLLDLNLAEAVHNLANAILQLLVLIPRATAIRCAEKEANQFSVLMCTPDMAPFFDFLAAGVSSLGLAIDNWANVALLIVETVLGGDPPRCATTDNALIPDLLAADPVFSGTNSSVAVVGLTDWLYAVTDGSTAVYMGHADGEKARMSSWPFPVDTALGIAAVSYSEVHDLDVTTFSSGKTAAAVQTTAMLGCSCSDADGRMQILCAVLPMSGVPSEAARQSYRLEVLFSDPRAPSLYTCAGVDIYVRSVRWSYTRYETTPASLGTNGDQTTLPTRDCISRGTCRELDATVWLIPRCGQDANLNAGGIACIPTAPCFPFCMAARAAGSAGANLVLVRSARWRSGATILGQDCALQSSTPESVQLGIPSLERSSRATRTDGSLLQTGGVEVFGFSSSQACVQNARVTSVLPKASSSAQRTPYNVRLDGQPFVITGDTLLTSVDLGGGVESVQVERLEGDEVDVFGLNAINQQLPSLPRAVVPLEDTERDSTSKVVIPYSGQSTRIAATNSRNYVFYASNPNADVLNPYLEYCADRLNPDKISKFGILFLSSYSQIRIYRVSAYRRCAAYSCGEDLVRYATIAGFSRQFGRECDEVFNVSVRALEYLNEDNIAVTVLSSPVTAWDAERQEFRSPTSRTYWLNPATMRLKATIWQTDAASSGLPTQVPQLCPALQRLPRIGSFAAEILNAGVFLVRYVVFVVAYTPGLVAVWQAGPRCPTPGSALYHSVLAGCGERVYQLDDFFDSLNDAGAVFWHSLSLLARLIAPANKPEVAGPLQNVLDGMSQYGQGAVDLWAGGSAVLTLTKAPLREQAGQLWATVRSATAGDAAGMLAGLAFPGPGVLAWARFVYRVFSTYAVAILKRFVDPLADVTVAQAYKLFWANLYDLQDEFASTVTDRVRLACGGIKLMFGVDNPWADLLFHQCSASAELTQGMLRLVVSIFVQIPMAKCVCKDAAGQSVSRFVVQRCAPGLPASLLPTLFSIANEASGAVGASGMACERVLNTVKASITGSMDGWFAHQYLAMDALASSVDYATSVFDDEAGRCLDFRNDAHVVVIVPQPVDYFQRCGRTSMCKQVFFEYRLAQPFMPPCDADCGQVCAAEWQAFQQSTRSKQTRPPDAVSVSMESMFFPGELDAELTLANASAVVELQAGLGGCLARQERPDFALAVAEVSGRAVRVQFWCAPQGASSSVYRSQQGAWGPVEVPGALLDMQFGDDTGAWLVALSQTEAAGQTVFLLNGTGVFAAPTLRLPGTGDVMLRVQNLWVLEGFILIDVLARRFQTTADAGTGLQSAESVVLSLHYTILPPFGRASTGVYGQWVQSSVDLTLLGAGGYWYTKRREALGEWLFLPRLPGMRPYRALLVRSGTVLSKSGDLQQLDPSSLPDLQETALSPYSQGVGRVFAVSRTGWDWLRQVRVDSSGFVEGVFGSSRVDYSLQVQGVCDERGCEGCLDLQTQRLCQAYARCALVNCIGTPVHQSRPLCGVGSLLRNMGRMAIVSVQSAWVVFTEMLGLTLSLSLLSLREAYLLWPEDAFLCFVCQAKDASASFFSILTATINSALQLSRADIGYMYGGASNVDTNADAVLTLTSTAINAFMHQLTLFPLYGLIVGHQIMMCQASHAPPPIPSFFQTDGFPQVSGVLALIPTKNFVLRIQSAQDSPSSEIVAGQCLTVGAEVLAAYPQDDKASLGVAAASLISNALQLFLVQQIEPFIHIIDGVLAYVLGVVRTIGTLVQSQNLARCNPPDFYLQDVVQCACGDQQLRIPAVRSQEGLRNGSHWCTGVLGLLDSNNQPYFVYNPYTYAQLQAKAKGMQAYVECVSRGTKGYSCTPPNEDLFAAQGVTLLNVLVKCRENFVKRRWDPAAHMLYQDTYWDRIHAGETIFPPSTPPGTGLPGSARACLREGDAASGSLAQQCLELFLLDAGISADSYWAYERLESANLSQPELVDGCQVFTGPTQEAFRNCMDGVGSGPCALPAHLWTPRSSNDVPLATPHRVLSRGQHSDGLVQRLYAEARREVLAALDGALRMWNNSDNPAVNAEFFSVEGDVLHQTMDCIMMGPYSRVDYWPIPACREGEECLQGPFWARDEGQGATRSVDTIGCPASSTLPYTCGSPGRRALMRYLVLNMLSSRGNRNQNSSNIGAIVRSTLQELREVWDNSSRFGCACERAQSPQCCASNLSSPLLPDNLNQAFTHVSSRSVLLALEDDMALLHDLALESQEVWLRYMPDVLTNMSSSGYDWSGSQRAAEEAFFDTTQAATSYSSSGGEAMSPLQDQFSTLWDVCHASLKQVFFTLPLGPDGQVVFDSAEAFDGDPARLQEYVAKFTREAFLRSPLFRHYSPRHAPSPSQMCEQAEAHAATPEGTVSYTAFMQNGLPMLDDNDLPSSNPAFHPQRFRVGARGCLCGWPLVANGSRCAPPARSNTFNLVCTASRACSADNTYDLLDEPSVLAVFSDAWYCPEFELSPLWGYLDPSAHENWLALNQTQVTTSARDLFRHGRAGLRAGNVLGLPALAKTYLNPLTREVPLERGRLTTCAPPPPPQDLLGPFLDELFPAAHGVEDSAPTVYCLRYVMELARLEVLRLVPGAVSAGEIAAQRNAAEVWRKRCGTQLHLLYLCASLRVFRPLREANSRSPIACPFFALDPSVDPALYYLTPQCLLSADGVFYDVCRCMDCSAPSAQALNVTAILRGGEACRLRFDPRDALTASHAPPLGWVEGAHPLPDPEAALLGDPADWARRLLAKPEATGNVAPGSAWWSAHGPMRDNSDACDTVLDWWPEGWNFPVGYHVTVPCEANETAFRSFEQAFALDEAGSGLIYQHELLRDAGLVDSHFGGAGLCRSGTFGMPMVETNNMRYCTRMPLDDTEDFTLPLQYGEDPTDGDGWTDWKCSPSSASLPWPSVSSVSGIYQSSRYSVGTIPNMPVETAGTYPAADADMFRIGPWQEIIEAGDRWGTKTDNLCQDFRQRLCLVDSQCPANYRCRGRVCSGDASVDCTSDAGCAGRGTCGGVCIEASVQCIRHSECPDDRMCSGVGTCETPVLAVQNRLTQSGEAVALGLSARGEDCGPTGRNFSLLQASYWGNTGRDILRAHGMCSFEDWFKYTQIYSKPGCSVPQGSDVLLLDPDRCNLADLTQLTSNQTKWWPQGNIRPEIMFVRPTQCDRDYERLQGFAQCAPVQGRATLLYNDDRLEQEALSFDQFVRLTSGLGSHGMPMAVMPELNASRIGFLGMAGRMQQMADLDQLPFVACGMVGQCFPSRLTVNGSTAPWRAYRQLGSGEWTNYSSKDAFTCGIFGVQSADGCIIDVLRFPLYQHLCVQQLPSCLALDPVTRDAIGRICSGIPQRYQATNQERVQVLTGLRDLFNVFPIFNTLTEYLRLNECISDLYAAIVAGSASSPPRVGLSAGLHYPFMFALYEVPFDWFYQCVVLSAMRLDPGRHASQSCQAYATRAQHSPDDYTSVSPAGDPFGTYLRFVRAGYLASDVALYQAEQAAHAQEVAANVSAGLVRDMFRGETDLSYPRCSRHIRWRIGPYGEAYRDDQIIPEARAVIWNWYDLQSCTLQWHEALLDKLQAIGVSRDNWIAELTDPDPVRLTPQDGSGRTTVIKEAAAFMLGSMSLTTLPLITAQSTGCIQFQNTLPDAYDHQARPLPDSLRPQFSTNGGTDVMDESVNRTCAFTPPYDPAFSRLGGVTGACTRQQRQVGTRFDQVQTCAGVDCSTVPVLYKRDGKFNCRYVAEAVILEQPCTETHDGCETGVADAVYAELAARFRLAWPSLPAVLRPRVLPWFAASAWQFEAVDFTEVLDYERNIQPNPDRAVMCEISTSAEEAVRFTTCNNPHFLRLQRHARAYYWHDGAVQIPAGAQLEWQLTRGLLSRGVMLSYANQNRSIRKQHLRALFDDDTVCKSDPSEHVCRAVPGTTSFQSLNPWTLGFFNPYEVCDVDFSGAGEGSREYINAMCVEQNELCQNFRSLSPSTCIEKNRRLVQQVGVPRETAGVQNDYNLCHMAPEEYDDGCMHDQGLLGGYDGLPVAALDSMSTSMIKGTKYEGQANYTVARNLYENSQWSIPDDFLRGVFAGTNPLWQGEYAPYGFLRVDENELGGHRIGVAIQRVNETADTISVMRLERLAMSAAGDKQFLDSAASQSRPTREWVGGLRASMQLEDSATRNLYRLGFAPAQLGASCPLQRWTFYAGGYQPFSPVLPAAKRARHLFHRIHGGLYAHPTMQAVSPLGANLGEYVTSNGFCACPVVQNVPQTQCRVPVADSTPCSLRSTMRALLAIPGLTTDSFVFPAITSERATRRCEMMLDWPFLDATMKDGAPIAGQWERASDPGQKKCHVLDRLRPFQYKYVAFAALSNERQLNTVSNGACRTARVVSLRSGALPAGYSRCLRTALYDTSANFACNTTETPLSLQRRGRLTLTQLLARRAQRRTRCRACSPPPGFFSQQGRPIPPESSFGRLHRVSPERQLASDLRRAICPPGSTACPALNSTAWVAGEFMRAYLLYPHRLFAAGNLTPPAATPRPPAPDADWTARPWVYCPTRSSLQTGQGCVGTMTRDEWARQKTKACPRMVRSYSAQGLRNGSDPMANTPFCHIDTTTDAICKAIMQARQLVTQANCIARGDPDCMPTPFVYHPASYEPSNNAWVHDSVKAFYRHVEPNACPQPSLADQGLIAFTRAYQASCPANTVNVFVGVIQAVRTVIVDVALMATTLLNMAFRSVQLFVVSGRTEARASLSKSWAYLRSKARATLDTASDLLVDALLNAGEAGARLMWFFQKTCDGLNTAAAWFLNVWCRYIQHYTVQFLSGIRRLLGITGAGFDMLQDFIDEIFKGVLPAAFVAKYANNQFQNSLVELYSQSSDKKKKNAAGISGNIPDSANPRPTSRTAERKSFLSRLYGAGGRTARGLAKASVIGGVALGFMEAVESVVSFVQDEQLRKLYPDNFTLFDFSDVARVVDELEDFILSPLSQDSCAAFELRQRADPNSKAFTCPRLGLDTLGNASTAGTTSFDATLCWANAAPSLGQNSLFSCTASSTCCATSQCASLIPCASCPDPALAGVNLYGCEALRQRCMCSVPVQSHTRCVANRQCDLQSQCELVSSLNGISYGTLPCASCPNSARIMCLLPPSGMPARCACMLAGSASVDLCNDRTGMRTPVDSSKLCAYPHTLQQRSGDSLAVWSFDMDDLIMLPCAQVSAGVCSTVNRGNEPLRMVVAETLRISSNSRRLLSDEQVVADPSPPVYNAYESEYELVDSQALHDLLTAPGWNTTAAPCSTLALAYQRSQTSLGLLETHVLHKCGFWRYVGRRVIERFNLSAQLAGHDTFLLSMDDLVYAAMSPEAGPALLRAPGLFAAALMYHPWMKPVRAFGVMLANQFEYLQWIDSIDKEAHSPLFDDAPDAEAPSWVGDGIQARQIPRRGRPTRERPKTGQQRKAGRRLLSTAAQEVLALSANAIRYPQIAPGARAPASAYGAWASSDFVWPPRYNYSLAACPFARSALDIALHVARVNKLYYTNFNAPPVPVNRSLRQNLPALPRLPDIPIDVRPASTWASTAFRWMLGLVGVQPSHIVALFASDDQWSFAWLLSTMTSCDLASTLTCSRHERDALMSTVIFVLLYLVISAVSRSVGVGFVATLFLFSYPVFLLWYAYGLAPTCFPSLPTCLLADVIDTAESLVPWRITFPASLLCDGVNQTCLRPCSDLGFAGWAEPLAFAVCDTDAQTCAYLVSLGPSGLEWLDGQAWEPFRAALARFQNLASTPANLVAGQRVCAWVTWVQAVPVLLLSLSILAVVIAAATAVLEQLPLAVSLLSQAFVFFDTASDEPG